jgi:hypothetical protein
MITLESICPARKAIFILASLQFGADIYGHGQEILGQHAQRN